MTRALGLDLGSKRIGVALSTSDGVLATPYEVVQRPLAAIGHAAKGAGQAREPAGKALSVIVEDELHVILTEADAAAAISRIADRMKSW